ncbi:hypothetical protein EPA93_43345 [Ktedonosporobacter rubrisoli]|uniref:Bacterial transcriptional activator domain-containing protein n=1 Tax=Ktedonosporobacter rubrisoli TaxID=2509675 RepID=A0A4P6K3B9_KTERU|nr:bacterial transcriptional activator domain-containing protein [Ktedonosporobacter rubrisoli]QBD82452.1 hypothetical protein EPA93_43345 [Ktedonosporobacter rubrisoli]
MNKETPSVRIWLFGKCRIEVLNKQGEWEEHKIHYNSYALPMLRRILCAPGRNILRETLISDMFPLGREQKWADRYLYNAATIIQRLGDILIKGKNSYKLASQSLVWCDIDECSSLMLEAEAVIHVAEQAIPLLEAASRLFERGQPLEGESGTWRFAVEAFLERKRKECMLALAQAYERAGMIWHAQNQYYKLSSLFPDDDQITEYFDRVLTQPYLSPPTAKIAPAASSWAPVLPKGIMVEGSNKQEKEPNDMDARRRELLKKGIELAGLSTLAVKEDSLTLPAGDYVEHCVSLARECWQFMNGTFQVTVESIISLHINPLMQIVYSNSRFKCQAAAAAAQIYILLGLLAMHRLDFSYRELCYHQAVICARISKDPRLLAATLYFLAQTYNACVYHTIPNQPESNPALAVHLFREAIQSLDGVEPLIHGVLYYGLAAAFSQCSEQDALDSLGRAQTAFPTTPENDPGFKYCDTNGAEFALRVGKTFLLLAQRYQKTEYYRRAQEAIEMSSRMNNISQIKSERTTCEILLHLGACGVGLNDLEMYVERTRAGLEVAKNLKSNLRFQEALAIFQDVPASWHTDGRIKDLKEFLLPM